MSDAQPFEPAFDDTVIDDLRRRLRETRWDALPAPLGWELGMDFEYLRSLCEHWASGYDFGRVPAALGVRSNFTWDGIHFMRVAGDGSKLPVLLLHGWPGAVLEYMELAKLLEEAGHEVLVPSLPGFGFSQAPEPALNVAGMSGRLRELIAALGVERYAIHGGDWGSIIGARVAFDDPERVAALHVTSALALPVPGPHSFEETPPSDAETEYLGTAQRWRTREGHHLSLQGAAPDSIAPALTDSPAGLAGHLLEKYRRWSDSGGDVETRFSRDQLCDFLTLYWATGTIGTSMRLYAAEARDRWRLGRGEKVTVSAAVLDPPGEILNPPREWSERVLGDLRGFTPMKSGGHFAAFEEPEQVAAHLIGFLDGL